jgi:hypothetical protein
MWLIITAQFKTAIPGKWEEKNVLLNCEDYELRKKIFELWCKKHNIDPVYTEHNCISHQEFHEWGRDLHIIYNKHVRSVTNGDAERAIVKSLL